MSEHSLLLVVPFIMVAMFLRMYLFNTALNLPQDIPYGQYTKPHDVHLNDSSIVMIDMETYSGN